MELEKSCGKTVHMTSKNGQTFQDRLLTLLYGNVAGRMLLRPLVSPQFSRIGGWLLNTRLSAIAVAPFVKSHQIDLAQYRKQRFSSYNDFFTREILPEFRPVDADTETWISPCDARLTVYPITEDGRFLIKHTQYTAESLLQNKKLAGHFLGGTLWLYRLCVDDYHRYIYPDNAKKSENVTIPGIFHTVNPVANDQYPIYKENTREYCLLKTENFGTVLMMEVGAMLVGKIENRHPKSRCVYRGQEKGNFAFGGSTIIVMTQAGKVIPDSVFLNHTADGVETKVKMGERTGRKCGAAVQ
ncbi:MAG: phosphatidylserine decarboxylase [Candidatus Choladocola sp.]|nr:phosphatidylserine decarboxylase [Candidatus Choladocola sp.]